MFSFLWMMTNSDFLKTTISFICFLVINSSISLDPSGTFCSYESYKQLLVFLDATGLAKLISLSGTVCALAAQCEYGRFSRQ